MAIILIAPREKLSYQKNIAIYDLDAAFAILLIAKENIIVLVRQTHARRISGFMIVWHLDSCGSM